MSDHTKLKEPNLWIPEQDQVYVALLGKLAEESSELASRASRCIIQGLEGQDPDDGRTNREHLADEIADVQALSELATAHFFQERTQYMYERKRAKYSHKHQWLVMLRNWVRRVTE